MTSGPELTDEHISDVFIRADFNSIMRSKRSLAFLSEMNLQVQLMYSKTFYIQYIQSLNNTVQNASLIKCALLLLY